MSVSQSVKRCRLCPRLVQHHQAVQQRYPEYHAQPVGAWGAARARVLLVGLAPGLHGACRTGKAFVGDDSGKFLFAALHRLGMASSPDPLNAQLIRTQLTNVVKCLPPGNAPLGEELANCSHHLIAELHSFGVEQRIRQPRAIVVLGGTAYRAACRALKIRSQGFAHGAHRDVASGIRLFASFHPSRLNVNTHRLTADMLDDVLRRARDWTQP